MFIAVTAIIVLSLLSWRMFLDPKSETVHLIDMIDFGICFVFFIDFLRQIIKAPYKLRYLVTWGPIADTRILIQLDLDADGTIHVHDLLLMIGAWGECDCIEDLTGDGRVSIADILLLISAWG